MRRISKAIEKLPQWAQSLLTVFTVTAGVYCIVHYGFWSTILHAIFIPEL